MLWSFAKWKNPALVQVFVHNLLMTDNLATVLQDEMQSHDSNDLLAITYRFGLF